MFYCQLFVCVLSCIGMYVAVLVAAFILCAAFILSSLWFVSSVYNYNTHLVSPFNHNIIISLYNDFNILLMVQVQILMDLHESN